MRDPVSVYEVKGDRERHWMLTLGLHTYRYTGMHTGTHSKHACPHTCYTHIHTHKNKYLKEEKLYLDLFSPSGTRDGTQGLVHVR